MTGLRAELRRRFEIGAHPLALVELEPPRPVRRIRFATAAGESVPGYLLEPEAAPAPAIVYIHAHGGRYDIGAAEVLDGRAALLELLHEAANPPDPASAFVSTSHHNADLRVDFESPDRARGTVSLYAWHRSSAGSRAEVWGYYFDRYRRTPDGWRIEERVLRACGEDGFPAPWLPIERVAPPERDQDPK